MFLHLGGDTVINMKDIIAIMDLDVTSTSKITREFLAVAGGRGVCHQRIGGFAEVLCHRGDR